MVYNLLNKTSSVILNYNDSIRSVKLAKKLVIYGLDLVVIVDNNSNFNERTILKEIDGNEAKRIKVIFSDNNQGFASGNNKGFKYLESLGKYDYVLEVNPDVDFEKKTLLSCLEFLVKNDYAISVSPICVQNNKFYCNFWAFPTYHDIIKKILSAVFCFNVDKGYYCNQMPNNFFKADAIRGSFQFFDFIKLSKIGYYDENTFLYYEENILYKKAQKYGYYAYIDPYDVYYHNHIYQEKTIKSTIKSREQDFKSAYYYLSEYTKINHFQKFFIKFLYYFLTPLFYFRLTLKWLLERFSKK